MATEAAIKKEPAPKEAAPAARPGKSRKKSKWPWMMILALAVIGAGGAAAWLKFKPPAAGAAADAPGAAATSATDPPAQARAAAIYYKFDPAFVVNFGGESSARYLQVGVEAMSRDQAVLDVLKNNEPAVRNDLILLFSSQDSAALMSPEGKEKLRAATLEAIHKVLNSEGTDGKLIEAVYFTSFVIQ